MASKSWEPTPWRAVQRAAWEVLNSFLALWYRLASKPLLQSPWLLRDVSARNMESR